MISIKSPSPETLGRYYMRVESGCWEWHSNRNTSGYGQLLADGKLWLAHRLMWTLVHGSIAPRLLVCHRCDNRKCVNPDHLFIGTHKDNFEDSRSKGRARLHLGLGKKKQRTRKWLPEQVLAIRSAPGALKDVAAQFGCSVSYVSKLRNSKLKASAII